MMVPTGDDLPLLTAATVVTRFCLADGELPHIAQLLDAFLDDFSSNWTLARCYKRKRSLRLLQYIAARRPANTLDPFYRGWVLNSAAWFIALQGDLPALQWLMEIYLPDELVGSVVVAAASKGNVEILEWLYTVHHERVYWSRLEMCGALDYGHDDTVQWLRSHKPPSQQSLKLVIQSAAKTGNLVAVQWLYNEYHAPTEEALMYAQQKGHWDVARWILVNCELAVRRVEWDGAAASGALSFLKYVYSLELGEPQVSALLAAASNGHLDIMKWLHEEVHIPLTAAAMRRAAESGHLDVMQWLHEMDCAKSDAWTMDGAARNGHLEVIKWLHNTRDEGCSARAMSWAAGNGHLDVVKWLHQNRSEGCTGEAIDSAASKGHLEIVQWLHECRNNGCSSKAMDGAARGGHLEIVKWLHQNRIEGCTTSAIDTAAAAGHLEVVKWLHFNRNEGCTVAAMDLAATYGHLKVVKWLHSNRTEGCSCNAMTSAASNGHLRVVKWLHANRGEGCASNTLSIVATTGKFEVVKWIYENRHEVQVDSAMKEAILHNRFDNVMYLHSKHVGIPDLTNVIFHRPTWGLAQWLVTNYPERMIGCVFRVPTWNYRFNDWCRQSSMQRMVVNSDFTTWRSSG
ncbi:putative ankyrin repeat protein [Phytophthora citrophthora]|uniref:Ankyrin repeat protein n=1 Tax=Phytophthora citrophthora TaxID=4793 RepID=A0AAD9GTQ7_9STRA|nr:putative ankyrin repeat protein [Phytophthora citrophthora]